MKNFYVYEEVRVRVNEVVTPKYGGQSMNIAGSYFSSHEAANMKYIE